MVAKGLKRSWRRSWSPVLQRQETRESALYLAPARIGREPSLFCALNLSSFTYLVVSTLEAILRKVTSPASRLQGVASASRGSGSAIVPTQAPCLLVLGDCDRTTAKIYDRHDYYPSRVQTPLSKCAPCYSPLFSSQACYT